MVNRDAAALGTGFVLISGLYVISYYNYLLFHSVAELFSIVIALGIFMLSWNARHLLLDRYLLKIGIASLFIGIIDLLHLLAYKGMGVFPEFDANLPTQLWIAARYFQGVAWLVALLPSSRCCKIKEENWLFIGAGITAFLVGIIFYRIFPVCYVEGMGLTPFKRISEYLIILFFSGAAFLLWRQRARLDSYVVRMLLVSILFAIGTELAFTRYVEVYDLSNLVGHFFKILSFYFIYRATIETGFKRP